jgi:hypothetical protein
MTWTSQIVMDAVKILRCPNDCVKHDAIVQHTKLTGRQVADACAKLVKHGYMQRESYADNSVKPGCYKLTALGLAAMEEGARLTSGPKRPIGKPQLRVDTLRERAWRVLRIRRKASVPELAGLLMDANSDEATIQRAQNNLNKYLRQLARAGYLSEMRREAPQSLTSNGAKRFLLVRDTGPLPPILQPSIGKVFDQNEGKPYDVQR